MALLAVAMELGAGLALHKAWRTTENSGEDWTELRNKLRGVRGQMVALATEMTLLQNEPAIFVARFWRNFYHSMLTHTVRNAMAKGSSRMRDSHVGGIAWVCSHPGTGNNCLLLL